MPIDPGICGLSVVMGRSPIFGRGYMFTFSGRELRDCPEGNCMIKTASLKSAISRLGRLLS
jgi:hypothetical protein